MYLTTGRARRARSAPTPASLARHKSLGERIVGRVLSGAGAALVRLREQRDLDPTMRRVRPYTMVIDGRLLQLARDVRDVLDRGVPGAFVECGVWRGGSSFLMADLLRRRGIRDRTVWMFDSFEGLPPATEIDGRRAVEFRSLTDDPAYFDNNTAGIEEVRATAEQLGLADHVEIVKGWFDASLPTHRDRIGPIALLRIDGDWYESIKVCLEQLYDQVAPDGLIVIDDYYDWPGAAIAVHEFLAARQLPHRIWTQVAGRCAAIQKTDHREVAATNP